MAYIQRGMVVCIAIAARRLDIRASLHVLTPILQHQQAPQIAAPQIEAPQIEAPPKLRRCLPHTHAAVALVDRAAATNSVGLITQV